MPSTARPLRERFEERVERLPNGCWGWTGGHNHGYAYMTVPTGRSHSRWTGAYRVAYELFVGPIPPKHDVHHRCRNRGCVNPEHLEAVKRAEHTRRDASRHRSSNATKTRCPEGHPYVGDNLIVTKNGRRRCRECRRRDNRAQYVKRTQGGGNAGQSSTSVPAT
jgi:hypothetical protein